MTSTQEAQSADADVRPNRPSANGWLLTDNRGGLHHASWAAPYFVFVDGSDPDDPEDKPLGLIHCETLADAQRKAALGGTLLDSDFVPVPL